MKTVLVLGAGTGGVITARELIRKSGNEEDINLVRILVFEKEEKSLFSPSLPWLMVGQRKPKQVYESTSKLDASGLEVITGEIEAVDPTNMTVTANGQQYKGDYMVVSLGVEQVNEHNLDQYGHNFYTLEGATQFHEDLKTFSGGNIAVVVPSLPFKSPAAPYEAAMLIEDFIRKQGLGDKTQVSLYTPESGPMEFAGKEASDELRSLLEDKGIKYYPDHKLLSASANFLEFSNQEKYQYELLAYTPKHQVPSVIRGTGLPGESGWIEVDRHTLETKYPDVYAIGDIAFIPLETGTPLPKIGIFAQHQAEVVAHNILRKIGNEAPDKIFDGEGRYFLEYGNGKASYAGGNFYASPKPDVKLKMPEQLGHWSKWWDEKYWFFKNF